MSYLLFLDESGHDHKVCPYEVRGGVALHISKLWSFIQDMQALEFRCFGDMLHKFGIEIKGERLLKKEGLKMQHKCQNLMKIQGKNLHFPF